MDATRDAMAVIVEQRFKSLDVVKNDVTHLKNGLNVMSKETGDLTKVIIAVNGKIKKMKMKMKNENIQFYTQTNITASVYISIIIIIVLCTRTQQNTIAYSTVIN